MLSDAFAFAHSLTASRISVLFSVAADQKKRIAPFVSRFADEFVRSLSWRMLVF
jgi:hypothetical protein